MTMIPPGPWMPMQGFITRTNPDAPGMGSRAAAGSIRMTHLEVDPVTLEIMRNRWLGIAEEMCAALVRASYSTNIKDRRDCSAAIALSNGEILAQAEVGTVFQLFDTRTAVKES